LSRFRFPARPGGPAAAAPVAGSLPGGAELCGCTGRARKCRRPRSLELFICRRCHRIRSRSLCLMTTRPTYLDSSATTPLDPHVLEKMVSCLNDNFGNPDSRSHLFGSKSEEAAEHSRRDVTLLVNANPREIIWTSGATEADNLAIKGAANIYSERGKHIVTV